MAKLTMMRHTETIFNKEGIFTGTVDIPLSINGIKQAHEQGTILKDENFDWVLVSGLQRSKETAAILLEEYYHYHKNKIPLFLADGHLPACLDSYLPIQEDARLNEKYYGVCQGQKKALMAEVYGKESVLSWRRDWDTAPEGAESLKDIHSKVSAVLKEAIIPKLQEGKDVLVICHQNPLRALNIAIENIDENHVQTIEFSNVDLLQYHYNDSMFHRISNL